MRDKTPQSAGERLALPVCGPGRESASAGGTARAPSRHRPRGFGAWAGDGNGPGGGCSGAAPGQHPGDEDEAPTCWVLGSSCVTPVFLGSLRGTPAPAAAQGDSSVTPGQSSGHEGLSLGHVPVSGMCLAGAELGAQGSSRAPALALCHRLSQEPAQGWGLQQTRGRSEGTLPESLVLSTEELESLCPHPSKCHPARTDPRPAPSLPQPLPGVPQVVMGCRPPQRVTSVPSLPQDCCTQGVVTGGQSPESAAVPALGDGVCGAEGPR